MGKKPNKKCEHSASELNMMDEPDVYIDDYVVINFEDKCLECGEVLGIETQWFKYSSNAYTKKEKGEE